MDTDSSNNLGLQVSNNVELLDVDLDFKLPGGGWFFVLCGQGWLKAGMLPALSNWESC